MKKRTLEKEHQAEERRKKVLMEIAGAVVVLTVIVSIGLSHLGTDKVNTSAGVKAIKKLEKAGIWCSPCNPHCTGDFSGVFTFHFL